MGDSNGNAAKEGMLEDSPEEETTMGHEFEKVINATGGFGWFQFAVLMIVTGSKVVLAGAMYLMSFGAKIPDWWCTDDVDHTMATNHSLYKACYVNDTRCDTAVYSDTIVTVASQFDLTCDRKQLSSMIMSIQLAGVFFGCLLGGQSAEIIGRKKTFFSFLFLLGLACAGSAFAPNIPVYAATRVLIGFLIGGVLVLDTGIPIEFTPMKWRVTITALPSWAVGQMIFALLAYLLRDWRHLSIATGVMVVPYLFGWFILPESMRWLLAHSKVDEAKAVVRKIASFNGQPCPDLAVLEKMAVIESKKHHKSDKKYNYSHLFKSREMLKKSLPSSFIWFSMGLASYGVSFGIVALAGDIFMNLLLSGIVAVPGALVTAFSNSIFGRRWSGFGFFMIAGLAAVAVVPISYSGHHDKGTMIVACAMTTKFAVTAGWLTQKLHTAEMFPTVVRNLGLGLGNTVSRIGAMMAPQLIFLTQLNGSLMYLIIGIVEIISALLSLYLPETKGRPLPDVINNIKKPNTVV